MSEDRFAVGKTLELPLSPWLPGWARGLQATVYKNGPRGLIHLQFKFDGYNRHLSIGTTLLTTIIDSNGRKPDMAELMVSAPRKTREDDGEDRPRRRRRRKVEA